MTKDELDAAEAARTDIPIGNVGRHGHHKEPVGAAGEAQPAVAGSADAAPAPTKSKSKKRAR